MVSWFSGRWHGVGSLQLVGVSICFLGILNLVIELSSNRHHYVRPLSPNVGPNWDFFWTIFRSPRWSHYFSNYNWIQLFCTPKWHSFVVWASKKVLVMKSRTGRALTMGWSIRQIWQLFQSFSFWCVIRDKHNFLAALLKADIATEQDFNLLIFHIKLLMVPIQTWR